MECLQKLKHKFIDMNWVHYNHIIRELKYGYVDAVKEETRNLEE